MTSGLPEKIEKLFLMFKKAIEAERKAQEMYKDAKELCDDELLKKVFEGFYQDEVRHERALIARYNSLRQEFKLEEEY